MFSKTSFKMSRDIQQISPPPVGGDEGEGEILWVSDYLNRFFNSCFTF